MQFKNLLTKENRRNKINIYKDIGPVAIIDTETTGINPLIHEVVEFAGIRVEKDGTESTFHTYIRPKNMNPDFVEGPYKEIVAQQFEKRRHLFESARPITEVYSGILNFLNGTILIGHNIAFDEYMLNANLYKAGIDKMVPYNKIDTKALAIEHLFPKGLKSASLDTVRKFLNLSSDGAHTAMKDVEDTKLLFETLWRRSRLD